MADTDFDSPESAADAYRKFNQQSTTTQAKNNLYNAATGNPDQAARDREIARSLSIPPSAVSAYPEDTARQAKLKEVDVDGLAHTNPVLTQHLSDPNGPAPIMHDDVPNAAAIERGLVSDAGIGVKSTLLKVLGAWDKAAVTVNDWLPYSSPLRMSEADRAMYEDRGKFLQQQGMENAPSRWTGMVTSGLTYAPFLAAAPAVVAGTEGAAKKQELMEQGVDETTANRAGVTEGGLMGLVQMLPLGKLIFGEGAKTVVKSAVAAGGKAAVAGGTQSYVGDRATQAFLDIGGYNELAEKYAPTFQKMLEAALFQGGLHLGMQGAHRVMAGDIAKSVTAEQEHQQLQALTELAAASKWRERDPKSFKDYVNAVTEDGNLQNVYVDGHVFAQEMSKAGVSHETLQQTSPEVAGQVNEALQTNGYVRIPTADYLTHIAGTELDKALLPHLKTDPEGMSKAESDAFFQQHQEQLNAEAKTLADQKEVSDAFKESHQAVHDDIYKQLEDAGIFRPEVNKVYAKLRSDMFATAARRTNMTPEEFYAKHGAKIVKGDIGTELELNQKANERRGPESDKVDPEEAWAEHHRQMAEKHKLTPEQEKQVAPKAERDHLTGLYADSELLPALRRAQDSGKKYRYVESDTFNMSGMNSHLGANARTDEVLKQIGHAYKEAFKGATVFRRGAGRFAAIVPEGFDVKAAKEKVSEATQRIAKENKLDEIAAPRASNAKGIGLYSSHSPIEIGAHPEDTIGKVQADIKAAMPQEVQDVNGSKALEAWGGSSLARRAGQSHSRESQEGQGKRSSGARKVKNPAGIPELERAERKQVTGAGRFLDPEAHRNQEYEALADRLGLTPEQKKAFHPTTYRDDLTGWFTARDLEPTIKRAQELNEKDGTHSTYVVADISNLGGMNKALGHDVADVIFRNMAEIVQEHAGGEKLDVVPFRHGGDEVSFVIIGADHETAQAAMAKAAAEVQRYVKAVGINDLPHAKYLDNPDKAGSGVYVGMSEVGDTRDSISEVMEHADSEVETIKKSPKPQAEGEPMKLGGDRFNQESHDQTQTAAFKKWAGTDRPVIEPHDINDFEFRGNGPFVMRAYHGTTHTFEEFNAALKGNLEGQFGKVNYFTSDEEDARGNYAGMGPDLTQRVEQKAERLADEITDYAQEFDSDDEAVAALKERYGDDAYNEDHMEMARNVVRQELHGGDDKTLEVYIKTDNPFVVGDKESPWLEFYDHGEIENQAMQEVADNHGIELKEVEENRDEYQDEIDDARYTIMDQNENPLVEAVQKVAQRYDFDPSELLSDLYDEVVSEGTARHSRIEELLRGNESMSYHEDPESGDLVQSHMIGEIIQELGFDSIILKNAGERFKNMGLGGNVAHIHVFDANNTNIKSVDNRGTFDPNDANIFKQPAEVTRGWFSPAKRLLALTKNANFSTLPHEMGHEALDIYTRIAKEPDAPQQIREDVDKLLNWFGIKGDQEVKGGSKEGELDQLYDERRKTPRPAPETLPKGRSALDVWHAMSLEEQRPYHEQLAQAFEKYFMEGKSPSHELQPVFSRLKSWMLSVYRSLRNLNVDLNPEVRGVFDRMLASEDAIKEAEASRGYWSLFTEKPEGVSDKDWQEYQQIGEAATQEAIDDMQARSLRDEKWRSGAKSRALKDLQKQADAQRREVRIDARRDVLQMPVYRAWQFLTRKDDAAYQGMTPEQRQKQLDPSRDSLLVAIAKLGGLDRDAVRAEWGTNPKDVQNEVFGKPVLRKSGGRSLDDMARALADHGYLMADEHGKVDIRDLEEAFGNELAGDKQYSNAFDYERENATGPTKEEIKQYPAGKMDLDALRAMKPEIGQEAIDRIEKLGMAKKGGIDPEIVSDMFGFESAEDIARSLARAEFPKEAIEKLTDRYMLERHGELATSAGIENAASEAVHNAARARFMATGLKILTKSPIPTRQLVRGAKEAADAAVAAKKVRDLNPRQYEASEARANKDAIKHAAKDPAAAIKAQRAALLNNQLVKSSQQAMTDVQKGLDYFKKFDKDTIREKMDVAFRDQIDALLERYDLRRSLTPEQAKAKDAMSLEKFVEKLASMKFSVDVPEKFITDTTRTHYKDMTVEDFRGLVDAVKSIEHLGREVKQVTDGTERRMLDEVAQEAAAQAETLPQRKAETNRGLTLVSEKWMKSKALGRSFHASLLKVEQMMDWMDGRNPLGVFNRMVFRKIADAEGRRNDLDKEITARVEAYAKALPKDIIKANRGSIEVPGVIDRLTGETQRLTWGEKISLAAIRGDAEHFAKLLKGEGWDANAVLDFLDKNMAKEEWDFVKGLAEQFQHLYPMKVEMLRNLGSTAPKEVERIPFQTRHGEMPGWYWPISYDPARSQSVKERAAKHGASIFEDNIWQTANTATGREMTRSEGYAKPMLLSIDTFPRILKEEIRDITTRQAIMEADRFISHPDVRKAISGALSPEHYDMLNGWLLSLANDASVKPSELQMWDRIARGIRTRTTMVGLGFRISTMIQHGATAAGESVAEAGFKPMFKGVFNAKTAASLTKALGPEWMNKGLNSFLRSDQWESNQNFIFDRSAEMRHRSNEFERDVREKLREIDIQLMDPATGKLTRAKLAVEARAYQGIAMLDMASALPTWMGAYLKGIEKPERGGLGYSEEDAVYFADKTVRNAHGGGGVKDMAQVQRGPEWFKLFTMFYTFWNHNINRLMDTYRRGKEMPATYQQARESGEWGKFRGDVGTLVLRTFMYTLGVQAIHHMLHPPKDDGEPDTWLEWFGKQMAMSAFSGIPLFRDIAAHYIGGKDYSLSPVVGAVDNTDRLLKDLDGQSDGSKMIKHALTEAGYITGLPLGQPGATVQFLSDVWDGKQHPQDVTEWWNGVIHGDMHNH